jgi:hypothetical protein
MKKDSNLTNKIVALQAQHIIKKISSSNKEQNIPTIGLEMKLISKLGK